MNHLCALQRADGKWDYTYNRRAYGYCRCMSSVLIPKDFQHLSAEQIESHNLNVASKAPKFHEHGHDTEQEACECYKQYLLDFDLRLTPEEPANASQQNRCRVCKKFTACYAMVGSYRMFTLCPEHQTRETVASLLDVGESWES